jgi:hypothetical protein
MPNDSLAADLGTRMLVKADTVDTGCLEGSSLECLEDMVKGQRIVAKRLPNWEVKKAVN